MFAPLHIISKVLTADSFASIHGPNVVINSLGPKIDQLLSQIASTPQYTYNLQMELSGAEASRIKDSTSQLKDMAKKVIFDAESIMSAERDSVYNHQAERIPERQKVSYWNIPTVHDIGRQSLAVQAMRQHIDPIAEDDDGTRVAFSRLVKQGDRKVQEGNLTGAETFYKQALQRADMSSLKDHPSIDRHHATLKLAKVLKQQAKFHDAKDALSRVCTSSKSTRNLTVAEAENFMEASHFLVGVLLELKELDKAEEYCRQAMLVASQSHGKASDMYQESSRLLGVVWEIREGEETSDCPDCPDCLDEAGPSERPVQPVDSIEKSDTRISEDSESSAEVSLPATRPKDDLRRPPTWSSVSEWKMTRDMEDEDDEIRHVASKRSSSKSPPSSPQRASSSAATRPGSEKKHTFSLSGSLLRRPSKSTISSSPSSEFAMEKAPPPRPIQRRPRDSLFGTGPASISPLITALDNNADQNMAQALKLLQNPPFSNVPPTFIGSTKFDPHQTLRKAIFVGQVEIVWMLLFRLSDLKTKWEKFNRKLGISMSRSKSQKFPDKIDPNYQTDTGFTFMEDLCLSEVLTRERKQIVELLLRYGVNVKPPYPKCIPLLSETQGGHYEVVEILLQYGAIPDTSAPDGDAPLRYILGMGVKTGQEAASMLVRYGANPNLQVGSNMETALSRATSLGWEKTVETLIAYGADLEVATNEGSPLCIAAANGFTQVALLLLDNKANIETISGYELGGSPLYIAASNGHNQLVRMLLEHGAKLETDAGRGTALCIAATEGHLDVVRMLLKKGANIEAIDGYGSTPLCLATSNNHTAVAEALLENGAMPEARSPDGTALCIAAGNGYTQIVSKLLDYDANFKAEASGKTDSKPLDLAAGNGHDEVVKVLLDFGRYKFTRKEVRSALNLAILKGHYATEMLLRASLAETKATE